MTSSPDFTPKGRSRPQLLASDKLPNTELVPIYKQDGSFPATNFRALVLSEDAGQQIKNVLLIDYGVPGNTGEPYTDFVNGPNVLPGTLADGPREVAIWWTPRDFGGDLNCHTVTMLVTHQFSEVPGSYYCPADLNDYATLTWFVPLCAQQVEGQEDTCNTDCPAMNDDIDNVYCDTAVGPADAGAAP